MPAPQLAMHASLSSSKVVPEPQSVFANALAMLASVKKTKHFFIVVLFHRTQVFFIKNYKKTIKRDNKKQAPTHTSVSDQASRA